MVKKNKYPKLKINFKFNNDISGEESNRIWFQLFDILLNEDENISQKIGK